MIIDESFISNAKKIAETQPQKNEVKVPEIRRENFEYHVYIYTMGIKEHNIIPEISKKLKSAIKRCDIFKETGNFHRSDEKIKNPDDVCYEFDADLFISIDTIYQMQKKLYFGTDITIMIDITGNGLFYQWTAEDMNLDMVYYFNRTRDDYMRLTRMWYAIREFNIGAMVISRWMIRNDVVYVPMSIYEAWNFHPAYISDIRSILKSYEYADIYYPKDMQPFDEPIEKSGTDDAEELRKIIEGNIGLLHMKECFVSMTKRKEALSDSELLIDIYPKNPVMIGTDCVYVKISKVIYDAGSPDMREEYRYLKEKLGNLKGEKLMTYKPEKINYKINML